ncbi:tissue factor isoform X1 [Bufo gargarizans]|uniref:tissue factor isoform X1 n=1 Tax=Bufo gargarizans TaxID=30331 RepID=UPI001CF3E170|nr:tissue factor isoform X1 [Bufo gargarizans]
MRCLHTVLLLVAVFCWQRSSAQGVNFPTATDIKVSSINCKTILDWRPKPTNYTYTVLVRGQLFQDWKKKCIYTKETSCDVSDIMQDIRDTYEIRIVSEIKSSEITEEFPYADGPTFRPYDQTIIGKPIIQNFTLNKEQNTLKVVIRDTPTPYKYANNTPITMRDMFPNDFTYTLFYRKASSTGKKQQSSATNEIVINTDKGESYCFFAEASVPSRKSNRESQHSDELCTSSSAGEEFDVVILVAVGISVGLIVLIVVLSVILCKCRNGKKEKTKEMMPLNAV